MSGIVNSTGARSGVIGTITQTTGDVSLTGTQTLTNKTLTSPVINTGVSGTANMNPACKMYMTNSYGSNAQGAFYPTGYTQFLNDDASLFTQGGTSTNGITIATAGIYFYSTWIYVDTPSAAGYVRIYLAEGGNSHETETNTIQTNQTDDIWYANGRSDIVSLSTGTYGLYKFNNAGTYSLNGGGAASTGVSLTWMGAA